ncbi:SP_0198 family lipoprotein [Streptococcus mitis]|uniref:SP_0198 family lipoprotein n=1 Tax=Streptococcus mitis TaxID=28037 RepID=UPI0020016665|nr:SP_0198 family lipoprotein [Streptococcus mitis]
MKLKRFTLSLASLASLSLLVACSQRAQQVQQPVAQQQVQQPAQQPAQQNTNTANAGSNQNQAAPVQNQPVAQPTDIDGTYTGQDDGDRITLVVTGTTGTWTKLESDGDQKVKQVTFDAANQRMIIGDDAKIYAINGNQMIIDDMDREASDRIVLSK